MSRFPIPPLEEQTEKQRSIEPLAMEQMFRRFPQLVYKDKTGGILGPYAPVYYTPDLTDEFFAFARANVWQPQFTARERELAVLAVISTNDAGYPLYAHSQIALECGISREQIQQAVNGVVPSGLAPSEAAVFSLARTMATLKGPLADESFEMANRTLGKAKIAGLTHLVAMYIHVALLCNVADSSVPAPQDGVFLATKTK